jgi:hypothetical protein
MCNNKKVNLSIHDPLINELNLEEFKTICYAGDKIISIDSDFNFKSCPFSEQNFSGDFFDILATEKLKNNKLCCLK